MNYYLYSYIAVALMTTVTIFNCNDGTIAKIKRVIMNQNTYPCTWELSTMVSKIFSTLV